MRPLYEIANEYRSMLDEQITEDGEIKDLALFEGSLEKFNDKAINFAKYLKNLEAEIKAIKDAETEMKKRRQSLEALLERREGYLQHNMEACDIKEISCPYFAIKLKTNRESVDDFDKSIIPEKFKDIKIVETIDKIAILKAIKSGENIPGARLVRKKKVEIK